MNICQTRLDVYNNVSSSGNFNTLSPSAITPTDANGNNRLCTYQLAVNSWDQQPYLGSVSSSNQNRIVTQTGESAHIIITFGYGHSYSEATITLGDITITLDYSQSLRFSVSGNAQYVTDTSDGDYGGAEYQVLSTSNRQLMYSKSDSSENTNATFYYKSQNSSTWTQIYPNTGTSNSYISTYGGSTIYFRIVYAN